MVCVCLFQISQLRLKIDSLQGELKKVNSLAAQSTEASKNQKETVVPLNKSPPSSTKLERRRVPSPSLPEPSDTEGHPDSPLSEEDIHVHENGNVSSEGESDTGEEDAFDNHAPSPVVPCPYIDFVPLQMEGKGSSSSVKEKADGSTEEEIAKKLEEETTTEVEENKEDDETEEEGEEIEKEEVSPEKELKDLTEKGEESTDGGESKAPCVGEDSGYGMAEEERGKEEEEELEVVAEENTITDSKLMHTAVVRNILSVMFLCCMHA